MPSQPLNCIEASSFEECKQKIMQSLNMDDAEFDEAYLFPMQMLVVYNPNVYPRITGTKLHAFSTIGTPKYPSIYFAYTYDDEAITLHYAELRQVDNE